MADSFTPSLNLTKPEVGASFDSWGNKVNGDMDLLDAAFLATGAGTSVGLHVGTGKVLNVEGQAQIADSTDTTKRALLDSSLISTATNRMYSFPDATGTFALQQLVMPTGTVISGYYGNVAPPGFVLLAGGTIGDAASSATARANADTVNLYTLLWLQGFVPVGGAGASAAADYAAHKPLALPDHRGRVMAARDNLGGTAANVWPGWNAVGQVYGVTTSSTGNIHSTGSTNHNFGNLNFTQTSGSVSTASGNITYQFGPSGLNFVQVNNAVAVAGYVNFNQNIAANVDGSSGAFNIVQPTIAIDVVIAL